MILGLGNEWAVVLGGLQSRFSFQVLAALRALHCNRVYEQEVLHPANPKNERSIFILSAGASPTEIEFYLFFSLG